MEKKLPILKEGLTYDDVLVVPAYSEVHPNEVSTTTYFSKNIKFAENGNVEIGTGLEEGTLNVTGASVVITSP